MNSYSVRFLPDQKIVKVEKGLTIAEAAKRADIHINRSCGGEGLCGTCRVRIIRGNAHPGGLTNMFFSEEEIKNGNTLACQTLIEDDLEIEIALLSREVEAQIMTHAQAKDPDKADQPAPVLSPQTGYYPFKPLVRKIVLHLSPPDLKDNLTDLERIYRELRHELGWHAFDISLDCLQDLSIPLREHTWNPSILLSKNRERYDLLQIEAPHQSKTNYGIALDLGTTTLVAKLVDLANGPVLGVEGRLNPQSQFGADVISRMMYAEKGGLRNLQQTLIQAVNQLIAGVAETAHVRCQEIQAVVAAGNTTMSHLLLGLNPKYIRLEPFIPCANIYPQIAAKEIGIAIAPCGVLEVLPSVASYVGGDIVAGVLSSGIPDHEEIQGLIDIGTNGEIAIGNKEWLVCCSASAGPAFEGGGMSCGMRAVKGAIEALTIQGDQVKYKTIANTKPIGICGSGMIDCIYELVKNRIIGSDGKFRRDSDNPRLIEKDDLLQYVLARPEESGADQAVFITEADISNLIKSKGAVFSAIRCLIHYLNLSFEQLKCFYVAGGFGNSLNLTKAIAIGLLPDIAPEKILFIGNSSLAGARLALTSEMAFDRCLTLAKSMTYVELSEYRSYMDEYVAALFLPHTDRKLFPSVDY